MPTHFGERVVLGLLDPEHMRLTLGQLGLPRQTCECLEQFLSAARYRGPRPLGRSMMLESTVKYESGPHRETDGEEASIERRETDRLGVVDDLYVSYQGAAPLTVHPPDLSTRGMFINTAEYFPVGAVLKIRCRLSRSKFYFSLRAEVRHCIPGVGIGVEFLELPSEVRRAIQQELEDFTGASPVAPSRPKGGQP